MMQGLEAADTMPQLKVLVLKQINIYLGQKEKGYGYEFAELQ